MFESRVGHARLDPLEARILVSIRPAAMTEKKIARKLGVDKAVLSVVITDLMLKGYLEIFRRRRMYFFSKEFCSITPDGLSAIENATLQNFFEMVRFRAAETLESFLHKSPSLRLVALSARTFYRVAKALI